jgi:hypothetical protein
MSDTTPTPDDTEALAEASCWHTYPPANADGTCPSCGSRRLTSGDQR